MKINTGKRHLLFSVNSRATATIDSYIESEDEQVLLGIITDSNFENYVNSIWIKESQKLNDLARVTPYMNIQKQRTII